MKSEVNIAIAYSKRSLFHNKVIRANAVKVSEESRSRISLVYKVNDRYVLCLLGCLPAIQLIFGVYQSL